MKISIVVPAYNAEKTLRHCLDSLLRQDFCGLGHEIIVVDNNSSDSTKEIIRSFPVQYIFEPKKGRAEARNRGFIESKGEFVAFLDSDCLAEKNWLKNLYGGFTNDKIGGCGGRLLALNPKSLIEKYYDYRKDRYSVYTDKDLLLPSLFGVSCMYRRKAIEEAGCFDTFFTAHEDTDLSFRVYLKGYQINNIPAAVVYHKYNPALFENIKKWFVYGMYYSYLKKKYSAIYKNNLFDLAKLNYSIVTKLGYLGILKSRFPFLPVYAALDLSKDSIFALGMLVGQAKLLWKDVKIIPEANPDRLLYRYCRGKLIVSEKSREYYYLLDGVGRKIWELLDEGKSQDEIVEALLDEYDTPEQKLQDDVKKFIFELKKAGIAG